MNRSPRVVALEREAIVLAASLSSVPVAEDGPPCPTNRLRVSWSEPGPWYELGAYVEPVGPTPTAATTRVNGIILCEGSTYAYMGFEAALVKGEWLIEVTQAISEENGHEPANLDAAPPAEATPSPAASPGTPAAPPSGIPGFRDMALSGHPGSRNLGIIRGCSVGGTSEHKEGRAGTVTPSPAGSASCTSSGTARSGAPTATQRAGAPTTAPARTPTTCT